MKITYRNQNVLIVRPGRWVVSVSHDPISHGSLIIHKEAHEWLDSRNIWQRMMTVWLFRRVAMTLSRSLHSKGSVDAVGRWKRAWRSATRRNRVRSHPGHSKPLKPRSF